MDFRAYQVEALRTDVSAAAGKNGTDALIVSMLGLGGEAGQLLSEYKKHLRDGEAHKLFKNRVCEELGDLLWYLANVASKFDLDLDDVARFNLAKVQERWDAANNRKQAFDSACIEAERLPRQMDVLFTEILIDGRPMVEISVNGERIGSPLGDNAYDPDGYRFHDVFHLSYAAVLGWSPNLRAFLRRKRKSQPLLDEVEDGGRARILEEAVVALTFDYARDHSFLAGIDQVDYGLLKTIRSMVGHLEVGRCSLADWEAAIFKGFEIWRQMIANRGGLVRIDLDGGLIVYEAPDDAAGAEKYHKVPSSGGNGAGDCFSAVVAEAYQPAAHAKAVG
ncbi:nucleoside triphosphate pyrophosphohydrolase family protein [Allomesorhizobium camelthorni]|uniref:Nucleoside triphosphate pyrophosphohydrolase family protein n=1 Tax=Allomesorhizobium camelthorni TaxID=475069 RepID=A0A6G4WK19_9HYPH|nr:nucleoside triphosphate pyrophosphohydrolase family protein [Mesorhizobium camelthorni]NGO54533.1 nucleoside triphosphate pyrophosphohydrolase family protein [Mesorhizobium camelthorni]